MKVLDVLRRTYSTPLVKAWSVTLPRRAVGNASLVHRVTLKACCRHSCVSSSAFVTYRRRSTVARRRFLRRSSWRRVSPLCSSQYRARSQYTRMRASLPRFLRMLRTAYCRSSVPLFGTAFFWYKKKHREMGNLEMDFINERYEAGKTSSDVNNRMDHPQ